MEKKQKINVILNKVLSQITYSKSEEKKIYDIIDNVLQEISKSAKKQKIDASVELGGSAAKRTFLKGDFDCDVFVRFSYSKYKNKNEELSKYLEDILKDTSFKYTKVHGSRDYFQFSKENIEFEIVPVLKIKKDSDALNVTDSTPFHVKWFLKYLNNQKKATIKLNNQVRLVKQFCKSQRIYGAESYINGFSGHVIDILTVLFGSFENFVNFFANQVNLEKLKKYDSRKLIFDVEEHYSKKSDSLKNNFDNKIISKSAKIDKILKTLNFSKIDSPIIVIDPISKQRNAASALGLEKYNLLINACKNFINNPDIKFFQINEFKISELKKQIKSYKKKHNFQTYCILLKIKPLNTKKDVAGAKIMKLTNYIKKKLLENSFLVYDSNFYFQQNQAYSWFFVDTDELNETIITSGPKVSSLEHAKRFKQKHPNYFKKENHLYAKVNRKFTNAFNFVNDLIKTDPYCENKCDFIKIKKITNN